MRGDLQTTSLADLCRRLADQGATGRIELSRPDAQARISLRDGEIIMATSPAPGARLGDRLVNAGLLSQEDLDRILAEQARADERTKLGALLVAEQLVTRDAIRVFVQEQILDAVFDLMRWAQADFVFVPGTEHTDKLPVSLPVSELLVEVSRRQSEWDQISQRISHLDVVPDFVVGGSSASAALEPDEFALMASVDGQRTIRELAADLGYSEFEAARVVYGLLLLGIVEVTDPDGDEVSAAPPPPQDEPEPEPEPAAEDDIDVAAALEDALRSTDANRPPPPPSSSGRPSVRVHLRDDGSYLDGPTERTGGAGTPAAEAPSTGEGTGGPAGGDRPEPEPDPWEVAGEEPAEQPPEEPADEAAAEAPDDVPGIEQLLAEMSMLEAERDDADERTGGTAPTTDAPGSAATGPAAAPPPEPTPGPADEEAVEQPPAETGPTPADEPETPERGEVSEFLRELSRLALSEDQPKGGPTPRPKPKPESPPAGGGKPPPSEPSRAEEKDDEDDGKKRRGLFGWGR